MNGSSTSCSNSIRSTRRCRAPWAADTSTVARSRPTSWRSSAWLPARGSSTSVAAAGDFSTALGRQFGTSIDYLGIDIVQALLDYAAAKAPPAYRFVLHRDLSIPAPSESADFVVAFSVFTHLRTSETLAYLADAKRVLRPGGAVVFSFLTLPQHWRMLIGDIKGRLRGTLPHLVTYTRPRTIGRWARQLGFQVEQFDAPKFDRTPRRGVEAVIAPAKCS